MYLFPPIQFALHFFAMGSRVWLALAVIILALPGLAGAVDHDSPAVSSNVVNTDLKAKPETAEAKAPQSPAPVEASREEQAKIDALLPKLDSDDFTTREAASAALAAMGMCTELTLRKIYAKPPSEEVRERVERLLSSIEALRCELTGEWEETKESISYKCYYRVEIQPSGKLTMRVTDYNKDQHYLFDSVEVKNGELCLHETFNPGFEFDIHLKPSSKDHLTGTATRRSDGLVLAVEYNRVTSPPANP